MSLNDILGYIKKCETNGLSDKDIWQDLYENHFSKSPPSINEQMHVYKFVYRNRTNNNPGPVWIAPKNKDSNTNEVIHDLGVESVQKLYEYSNENKEAFYDYMLKKLNIVFSTKYKDIIDKNCDLHEPNWLPEAKLNIVDSCLNATEDYTAITFDSGDNIYNISYLELNRKVNSFASNLKNSNINPGDCVGIFMPMNVAAIVAYLAIIKIGAVAVSIADSFSVNEIQMRLDISKAKYLITQDKFLRAGKIINLYQRTLELKGITTIVISDETNLQALEKDIIANNWFYEETKDVQSYMCSPHTPINILFSSGTTGAPKAIPWDHTTPIKAAIDGCLNQDIQKGDVVAWPTNMGWMMGPWLVFATLINKGCIAISEHAPVTSKFCEFIQNAKVSILGVVPSIVKKWKDTNALNNIALNNIKLFTSTGESSNPDDMFFLMASANYKPVIEYCGGTEIGGAYASGTLLHDCIPSTFPMANFATQIALLNENGKLCSKGELALIPPTMGFSKTLLNGDHFRVYHYGMPIYKDKLHYRRHGDEFMKLDNGYYRALGRCDDTMNLGAIKTSSAEIERCLSDIRELQETAAIAVSPQDGGPSQLVIFVVTSRNDLDDLKNEVQQAIKDKLNPLFKVKLIKAIDKLPRTSSNKVMRRVLRDLVVGDFDEQ